jgi:hypothetical protein
MRWFKLIKIWGCMMGLFKRIHNFTSSNPKRLPKPKDTKVIEEEPPYVEPKTICRDCKHYNPIAASYPICGTLHTCMAPAVAVPQQICRVTGTKTPVSPLPKCFEINMGNCPHYEESGRAKERKKEEEELDKILEEKGYTNE